MDWTYSWMYCTTPEKKENMYYGETPVLVEHFDPGSAPERSSETPYTTEKSKIHKTKTKKMKTTNVASCETPNVENMKTKPGTAKPSGAGVGKGGPKTSPTDGGSLKVKGGGGKGKKKK